MQISYLCSHPGDLMGGGAPAELEERADPGCAPELVNRAHQAHCCET